MIREMREGDTAEVMDIWLEENCRAHDFLPEEYWREHYGEVRDQYLPASRTFVEELGGRIAGFASLIPGERYYLGALFVRGICQGMGVGTRLLNRCKEVWPELSLQVFEQNGRALRFYEKQGFVPVDHKPAKGTGCNEYTMVYRRPLNTDRLILRPWKMEDALDMFEYARDGRVGPAAGWPVHKDLEESQRILSRFILEADTYAMELRDGGKVIGSIGLHKRIPDLNLASLTQREIGYVLNPSFWGNGYMPEAVRRLLEYGFEELELDMIWCGHYDFNHNSRRVIEKCGFRYQFSRAKKLPFDNREVMELYYNIRSEDYRGGKNTDEAREWGGEKTDEACE